MISSIKLTRSKSSVILILLIVLDKAPRSRSKKLRRYEHVDITKDFEIRTKRREAEKLEKLEELYKKHDLKALEMRDIISSSK